MSKLIWAIAACLVSFQIHADTETTTKEIGQTIQGIVEEAFCGELDPFIIGDACLIFTTDQSTGRRVGLYYHDYDWMFVNNDQEGDVSENVGRSFTASTCEKIYSSEVIAELQDYNPTYFYLSCYAYDFNFTMEPPKLTDKVIVGTVDDVACVEVDPFAVGDACLVFMTEESTGRKIALVYQDYDWYDLFVPEDSAEDEVAGDRLAADHCETYANPQLIEALKDYNSDYFYMACSTEDFYWYHGDALIGSSE